VAAGLGPQLKRRSLGSNQRSMTDPVQRAAPRPPFQLTIALRVATALVIVLALVLIVAGLVLPLMPLGASVAEGLRRSAIGAIRSLLLGVVLLTAARALRRGSRRGAAITIAVLLIMTMNALLARGLHAWPVVVVAAVLTAPIVHDWHRLA